MPEHPLARDEGALSAEVIQFKEWDLLEPLCCGQMHSVICQSALEQSN